jgi:hypothetical protein
MLLTTLMTANHSHMFWPLLLYTVVCDVTFNLHVLGVFISYVTLVTYVFPITFCNAIMNTVYVLFLNAVLYMAFVLTYIFIFVGLIVSGFCFILL